MAKPQFAFSTKLLSVTSVVFFLLETPSTYTLMKILEPGERVVDHGVSMKDVTFGAAREVAGSKAGMDDNSENGMLFFVPSNKGESFSSLF